VIKILVQFVDQDEALLVTWKILCRDAENVVQFLDGFAGKMEILFQLFYI
jgi:hypothetical protein